jgi:hypothetical protein
MYTDYINQGGGMEFLTHQGKFTRKSVGIFGEFQTALGYLGETSEIIGRLAVRERAIKNGASPEEATWIARNYLDFAQGGSLAKAVDSGIPYLNAATQGTRGIFRAAEQKPAVFTYKVAQIMALATGLYYANTVTNKEAYDQVSERDKIGNFIITTPFSFKDKDGNKKWYYFSIPKDQGQRVMTAIAENLTKFFNGESVNIDEITGAIADFLPLVPTNLLPPSMEALLGYLVNKDFWRNKDIWSGGKMNAQEEEYNNYTHPTFVSLGKLTGLSPTRMKFAISKMFATGNPYTALAGLSMKTILGHQSQQTKNMVSQELIMRKPFIRKIMKTTRPFTAHEKQIEKIKVDAHTKRYSTNRAFDKISQGFFDKTHTDSEVRAFSAKVSADDREKVLVRAGRYKTARGKG